ncbi:imidazole glycerol phosphate synthase subunit HisH [bacterium]|nr:MAG: imidazole glycerol phosphate synthase subunit HisH [bacterium]
MDVAIIDSGGANLASLGFALDRLGARSVVTTDESVIRSAPRVLLPGVGAAADAMVRLDEAGLTGVIPTLTQPVLGICLGMQLLFDASTESGDGRATRCLGIVPGTVDKLPASIQTPVPHMGWNQRDTRIDDPLFDGLDDAAYFYFVHSYAAPVGPATIATTRYGQEFTVALRERNFRGVQFHPERSARSGSRLLENFLRRVPCN